MTRRYLALCCWLLCLFTLAGCVSPFREVDRVGAVSYTHLDVYKRQPWEDSAFTKDR